MEIISRVVTTFQHKAVKKGERISLPDADAQRWLKNGLATPVTESLQQAVKIEQQPIASIEPEPVSEPEQKPEEVLGFVEPTDEKLKVVTRRKRRATAKDNGVEEADTDAETPNTDATAE